MLAVGTSAIRNGDAPRSPISHADPTLCINVPMLDASWAMNNARKTGYRSGAHGDWRGSTVAISASLINPQPYAPRRATTVVNAQRHSNRVGKAVAGSAGGGQLAMREPDDARRRTRPIP